MSDEVIRNAIIAGATEGLLQDEIAAKFGHKKNWITYCLKKFGLNWKELKDPLIQEKPVNTGRKIQTTKKSKKKGKKKEPPQSQAPPEEEEPDEDDDADSNLNLSPQFKEIVDVMAYAQKRVDGVNFGNMITFYKETKQLENEQKDFEEGQILLKEFESKVCELQGLFEG